MQNCNMKKNLKNPLYLLVPTLTQFEDGSSTFSMIYSVIKLPPSLSGGFHVNVHDSSVMFSAVGNLGGSGRSEIYLYQEM